MTTLEDLIAAQRTVDEPTGTVVTQDGARLPATDGESTRVTLEEILGGHVHNRTVVRVILRGYNGEELEYVGPLAGIRLAGSPGERRAAGPRVDMDAYHTGPVAIVISDILLLTANENDHAAAIEARRGERPATRTSINERNDKIRAALADGRTVERIAEITELSVSYIKSLGGR